MNCSVDRLRGSMLVLTRLGPGAMDFAPRSQVALGVGTCFPLSTAVSCYCNGENGSDLISLCGVFFFFFYIYFFPCYFFSLLYFSLRTTLLFGWDCRRMFAHGSTCVWMHTETQNPAWARQTRTHGITALVELGPTAIGWHSALFRSLR